MCGIAGLISFDGSPPDRRTLQAMISAVAHRGPDGEGMAIRGTVGLGHRRLAIVDLSEDGQQPMLGEGGDHCVVFNGEIYNFVELREELRALGHQFRTSSDTEVLLAAYAHWGEQCVDHFNGMWAFALHDTRAGILFCSRDRFGVKPFYYTRDEHRLAFGSEIRQLLPLLPAVRADREAVRNFLFAGIDEPLEGCFFEGIQKLPGGHTLTVDLITGAVAVRRAYVIGRDATASNMAPDAAATAYGTRLEDAVRLRLRADVPVGTCLSGGLDSSSVAAIAAPAYLAARGERFRAITAVSEEPGNDETPFAEAVVERSGLDWIKVRPTYDDFASTIAEVVRTQEEPFGGPSICMQWFVMRTARANGIPVLLDGQGGDETLLGYRRYFAAFMLERWREHGLASMLREMKECKRNGAQVGTIGILLSMLLQGSSTLGYLKLRMRCRWMRSTPAMPDLVRTEAGAMSNLNALQRLDIERANLPALLRFEDKNSMRFSVETRLPFLDWRSVETALSLPAETKFRGGWTKWVLRQSMRERLPEDVTWRRWKIGFEAPAATWLARHADQMQRAVDASALIAELARPGWLTRKYASLHPAVRWRLFSVAMWEQAFDVR